MKATDFIKEIKADDLDQDAIDSLKKQIDPADKDDGDLDKGYSDKHVSMINQVHKVIDSQGNPNPVKTVSSEDGGKFPITGWQAKMIAAMLTSNYNQDQKRKFTDDVNKKKEVLGALLSAKTPEDMKAKFFDMYSPKEQPKSSYEGQYQAKLV